MPSADVPRLASTLVLLRDGVQGLEVLLMRRSLSAAFVAGAYVFPGGAVDEADAAPSLLARVQGLTEDEASARCGVARGGLGFWAAALRECFEEAGILLALDEHGEAVDAERASLPAARASLHEGRLDFGAWLERERLTLAADALAYFAHWVTPVGPPRRFDTRFFVALAPRGQDASPDGRETIDATWLRPEEALLLGERGEIDLVAPTRVVLQELARFESARAAFEHAAQQTEVETHRPCRGIDESGSSRYYGRGEPAYFEIHWVDPDERGDTRVPIVPLEPRRLDRWVTRITAPNAGPMTGPGTNTYLVGSDALTVIDPGPAIAAHRRAVIAAGAGRIRRIVCTHTHPDHAAGAAALRAATGVEICGVPAPLASDHEIRVELDRVLVDGERLELGGCVLEVVHTPGHASNHLCFLLEATGMLFTGDHIMQGSTVVIDPPDGDMGAYLASLGALQGRDLAILAPGHGYLVGEPRKAIARLIAHRHAREAKVLERLGRLGESELMPLVAAVYDDVATSLHPLAARSLLAHLGKLEAESRVLRREGRYVLRDAPSRRWS